MAYKIVLSESATAELEGLDRTVMNRVVKKLKSIASNPQRAFVRLTGSREQRLRIGDYRIIATILPGEETVLVIAIGHRRNVYKKR